MYQKQKALTLANQNVAKVDVIDIKRVIRSCVPGGEKTRGEKMKVSPIMLLKTNGENMSVLGLAIMLLKQNEIESSCHYVYENTRESRWRQFEKGEWRGHPAYVRSWLGWPCHKVWIPAPGFRGDKLRGSDPCCEKIPIPSCTGTAGQFICLHLRPVL